jgi:putative transposase
LRQAAISGLVNRRTRRTTIRVPGVRVAEDLVARQFRPAAPNALWVADITAVTATTTPSPRASSPP